MAQTFPLVILDDQVNTTFFACDLAQCKGACCTMKGGAGAPVTDEEIIAIANAVPAALPYLTERSKKIIASESFVDDYGGALRCIDDADCVFVFYDSGVAKCSLERAYFDGKSPFRKPLSCHLFPIRRSEGAYDHLRVEKISECSSGYRRGAAEKIPLLTFAKEALVRAYGEAWYTEITKK